MKRTGLQSGILYAFTAVLALALTALPQSARAYGLSGVGGMVGYSTPQDLDGTASVSVHAELEQPGTRLHLVPNMMYWNVDRANQAIPGLGHDRLRLLAHDCLLSSPSDRYRGGAAQ